MIKNILYICVLTVFLLPHIYYGCPTVCTCEDTVIGCVDNGLTEVPNGIPITTTYLDIHDNNITSLPEGVFSSFVDLTHLELSTNQITSLPEGLFSNNPALSAVNIRGNQIRSVPVGLFSNNPALFGVGFADNLITSLPEGLLSNNPDMQIMYINGNQITSLPAGLFSNNPILTQVYLYGNQITRLPDGLFTNNPGLNEVHLNNNQIKIVSPMAFPNGNRTASMLIMLVGNPLVCCNMSDLIDYIQEQTQTTTFMVSCSETPNTDSFPLENLNTSVCPQVDGQWSDWSESSCSSICGVGNMTRTRECSNPEPSINGQECHGEASDVIQCYKDCPTDEEFNWIPLVIGLVVGTCVLIGIIVLLIFCVTKAKGGRISNGN